MLDEAAVQAPIERQNDDSKEDSPRDRPSMLMVSPEAPWPATTGGLVRIGALLNQMARYFHVTFVSPRWAGQSLPDDPRVRLLCPELPRPGLLRRAASVVDPSRPYHVSFYSHPEIRQLLRSELTRRSYDVVFGHFIYCLEYLSGTRARIVIDQQNVDRVYWENKAKESLFPLNIFSSWNMRKTVAFENRRLHAVWGYVSVSEADRVQTRAYAESAVTHFWVAPNGVDTRRFTPAGERDRAAGPLVLGYVGSMDLQMNIDAVRRFCTSLLPRIRRAVPRDIRFLVIGRAPTPAIRQVAEKTPGVSLTGTVEDIVPWLRQVDILVCPLRIGAGTKLKVAEAMSCEVPVVGSSLAFAGVPGESGEHFIRADTDEGFIAAVCQLVNAPDQRVVMGRRARMLAQRHLEWDTIGQQLARDITCALATE